MAHDVEKYLDPRYCKYLHTLKNERDPNVVKQALEALQEVANNDNNIMPHIIHAVEVHATLGEISDTLRSTFGTY